MSRKDRELYAILRLLEQTSKKLSVVVFDDKQCQQYHQLESVSKWLQVELMMSDAEKILEQRYEQCDAAVVILTLGKVICDKWSVWETTGKGSNIAILLTDCCYTHIRDAYMELMYRGCDDVSE